MQSFEINNVSFDLLTCGKCGIMWLAPSLWRKDRESKADTFYCPNGDPLAYHESEADRVRKASEQTRFQLQAQLNEANHAKLVAEKERDKAIKDKRKVERRIAHGVCPCCNQTFADIANHMLTEHKDFRLPEGKQPKLIRGAA